MLQWYPVHEISFVCFFLLPVLLLTFLYVSMVVVIKTATKASIRSTFSSHLSFAINNKWVDVFSDPLKVKFKKIPKTEKNTFTLGNRSSEEATARPRTTGNRSSGCSVGPSDHRGLEHRRTSNSIGPCKLQAQKSLTFFVAPQRSIN